MCDEEVTIQITDEIQKIMVKNLDEKSEVISKEIDCCTDCRFYDKPWVWGRTLHCCSHDKDNVATSRDINELYINCPINHKMEVRKTYIKKYGIIHQKPKKHSYYSDTSGSIAVVDFSGTTFEWDGNNPDVDWRNVVVFFYDTQEEADKMMELALDYYHRFNLDAEYIPKHCFG